MHRVTNLLKAFKFSLFLLLIFITTAYSQEYSIPTSKADEYPIVPNREIHNIIFFIGDGMGLTQLAAGRLKSAGADGKLNIEKMPVTGLMTTSALDELITDSAAGATAMACGFKTNNGAIAMLPDGTKVKTILEALRDDGYSTGLIATSSITHATPACFVSHVPERRMEPEIAKQFIESDVDILMGGGKSFFIPQSISGSNRSDNNDLIAKAKTNGYQFVENKDNLAAVENGKILGLFRSRALENKAPEPSLAEMTAKSLQILSQNKKGFFLMAEGSQIDWGGHDNDADYAIREMLSFDKAVKVGLDFAKENQHTLVVVTADHETGGMAITGGSLDGEELEIEWAAGHHTCEPVPIFAYGPHGLLFTGVHDNTEIAKIFARVMKLEDFPQKLQDSL